MIFSSVEFFLFFGLVLLVHWGLLSLVPPRRREGARQAFLLAASYYFYMSWNATFILLILASTLIDFLAALYIHKATTLRWRRFALVVSLFSNLGLLGVFKYANFFLGNLNAGLGALGHDSDFVVHVILPVGISFFTFQSMSYTIDVYRGKLEPIKSFPDFALYVAFFPQLVAGPIVRAIDFLPQLKVVHYLRDVNVRRGINLFLVGLVKKALISDWLSIPADAVFSDPSGYSSAAVWVGVISYALQIYCDFSGYSDMAIGAAALLGYQLPENFNMPYVAANITDFWRRWHISLSTWLRDYLYISLGGNRGSKLFTYRNLMLTMLLGGLWHGASWTFVVWGGLHGLGLIVHKEFVRHFPEPKTSPVRALRTALGIPVTFIFVSFTWVFFRSQDFSSAAVMIRKMVAWDSAGITAPPSYFYVLVALVVFSHLIGLRWWRNLENREPSNWLWPLHSVAYAAAIFLVILFAPHEAQPFIYFQF